MQDTSSSSVSDAINNPPDWATSPIRNMRVSLIQTDLIWHEPEKNREHLSSLIRPLKGQTELVVLPEMFTSGFTMHPEEITECASPSITGEWMLDLAAECQCAITGSIAARHSDGAHTNRALFARPDGTIEFYDKRHLFRMGGEHERYKPGNKRVVINYLDWKILLTTCYDLRFPVFCRNRNDYDLMLCVANWPAARRQAWRQLLQA
ncbi:MAG: nitrilase-related carbon-nitrogen hydrolase, partial [Gammaproteobacteria bacterium]